MEPDWVRHIQAKQGCHLPARQRPRFKSRNTLYNWLGSTLVAILDMASVASPLGLRLRVALRELRANYSGRRKGWVAPNQFDLDFLPSTQSFSGLHRKFPTNRVK
jgi:hypothetical protein